MDESKEANAFYHALYIYLKKTQVINRKLSCVSNVVCLKTFKHFDKNDFIRNLKALENVDSESVEKAYKDLGSTFDKSYLEEIKEVDDTSKVIFISIDRMLPRNVQKYHNCTLLTIIDVNDATASFYPLNADTKNLIPSDDYKLTFSRETNQVELQILCKNEGSSNWLQFVLIKKVQSWIDSFSKEEIQQNIESHNLINSELYNSTYASLKEKYGRELEANWKETTDPKKFIYEDIAIASYLIVLWKHERDAENIIDPQSFVDLGCGNGLLVYILSQEGHRGYGIDLRKRKIWDQYPSGTDLREYAIIPSDENLFPDIDWIIGNHSDELSPWISVISARSSYKSRYFLLPCCAFEFSGAKYQRKGGIKSLYMSYIDYLLSISDVCGFSSTKLDRLKIPSTKRICIIATGRIHSQAEFQLQCQNIQNFINQENSSESNSNIWSETFKPRDKIEPVRNCTKIEKSLKDSITKVIFDKLLEERSFCDKFPEWNCGGKIRMSDAVNLILEEDLKKLKSECGGLQTILRNKHQIFEVHGGVIKIRMPQRITEKNLTRRNAMKNVIKTLQCYFYKNHPNACPLNDSECCYRH
ncbi:CLUMA_CG018075, isoform A [Clunio marinus]|uniref:tRNA (uracil-O(2)-)-methyltransferase n=1 Tax=Clunio marinus TaxID=568069 RepID=A0A1J1J0S0_9DIPT|nr:CLUMA_CG018075, isoform A [Clunio marinus]